MEKVAIYVRVSTEEQAEDGYSIDGQINALTEYSQKNGLEVFKIYKDEGISAKSVDRPGLQELLEDCKHERFSIVAVWKISRLSRKQLDFLTLIEEFKKHNVKFFSFKENIDASTPMGMAMLQVMGTFAELDRNTIVENVKLGMSQRAREGLFNGGSMLGYTSKDKHLIIVEDEAIIVRHIFKLYLSGKGFKAIANQLNHEGYKTKRNQAFSTNSVRQIILNPAYAGFIRYNKQENWSEQRRKGTNEKPIIIKGLHEPLIDLDTWDKVGKLFESKSAKPTKTFTGHYPLTTLLRCPMCGQGMIGHRAERTKGTKDYIRYYQCGNFHYKGSAVCNSNLIWADYAEAYVYKKFEEASTNKSLLNDLVGTLNSKIKVIKEPLEYQMINLQKQIDLAKKNQRKYAKTLEECESVPKFIIENLTRLELEIDELTAKMNSIQHEMLKPTVQEVSIDDVYSIISHLSKLLPIVAPEKQKHLLHSVINKITLTQANKPKDRRIKDIELVFNASKEPNHVLTYGTVPPE